MTKKEYLELMEVGQDLCKPLLDKLNSISDKFIRTDALDVRTQKSFREICIALALQKNIKDQHQVQ